jgi:uncharacterized protein (TIGR03382 family)
MLLLISLALAQDAPDVLADTAGAIDIISAPTDAQTTDLFYRGMGAPTIVRDGETYVLFFETQLHPDSFDQLSADVSGCGNARVWGIGRATSNDGITWDVDDNLVIEPAGPGSYDGCVVAQPEVSFNGERYDIWYKAEQQQAPCPDGQDPPSWGCDSQVGVGHATSTDGITWERSDQPAINIEGSFGYPRVTQVDGQWTLFLSVLPDFLAYTATEPDGPWTPNAFPAVTPGDVEWARAEVIRPSLLCDTEVDADGNDTYGYRLWTMGRATQEAVDIHLGRLTSADGLVWDVETPNPVLTWNQTTGEDWRAIDVLRTDIGDVLYYSRRDLTQTPVKRRIGVAWTTPTNDWSAATFFANLCPAPLIDDPEGTETPEGTDDTSDSLPIDPCEEDPESEECVQEKNCGCQSSPSPVSGFALGVVLFGLLRTRRRRG